jgi:DNA topoisomerase-1
MEDDLDKIASGQCAWRPIIQSFYIPFHNNLMQKDQELSKKNLTEEATDEKCDKCGSPMVVKMGRFGKFLACTNFPDCKNTKPINGKGEVQEPQMTDERCDKCGKPMAMKQGRYGSFLGCTGYPECKNIKSIQKSTGIACPKCSNGEIVEKRTRAGKTFYACNQYPACENAYWSKPLPGGTPGKGKECPDCQSLLVYGPKESVVCSSKSCSYKE